MSKFVMLVLGIMIGVGSQLRNSRCGDGNKCWCSESTKIVSCVDSNLMKMPSFSTYIKSWVRRLNLRFNSIVDLAELLRSDFPRLDYVDVRNNAEYQCGDIHNILVGKGLIIDSDCSGEEVTFLLSRTKKTSSISPKTSTTPKTPPPTSPLTTVLKSNELTTEQKMDVNVTGDFKCYCDISLTVSITAIASTLITTLVGFLINYLRQHYNMKKSAKISRRFNAPRPSNYKPRINLFDDLSSIRNPVYTGSLRPKDIFPPTTSDEEEPSEGIYEIPLPSRRAPPVVPSAPTPSTSSATVYTQRPSTAPPAPPVSSPKPTSTRPYSAPVTTNQRGRPRGRGRGITSINVSHIHTEGPPARNTRSSTKNKSTFTSHM